MAKAYNLTKDEVTFGLPLSDVRGTRLSTLCQIKVDFPCQPGKYRAYNGYCNNVQNPNWGKMSSNIIFLLLARHNLFIGYFFCQGKRAIRIKQVIFHLKVLISGFFIAKGRGHGHHSNDSPSIFRTLK